MYAQGAPGLMMVPNVGRTFGQTPMAVYAAPPNVVPNAPVTGIPQNPVQPQPPIQQLSEQELKQVCIKIL